MVVCLGNHVLSLHTFDAGVKLSKIGRGKLGWILPAYGSKRPPKWEISLMASAPTEIRMSSPSRVSGLYASPGEESKNPLS